MPNRLVAPFALFAGVLPLVACTSASMPSGVAPPLRSGSPAAEAACVAAVNTNFGRSVASVTESVGSEAGSEVTLSAAGERFRCVASSDGVVADLRAVM